MNESTMPPRKVTPQDVVNIRTFLVLGYTAEAIAKRVRLPLEAVHTVIMSL